jgi:hypothetical protein
VLARNGAVTLDSNDVVACSGGPGPPVPPARLVAAPGSHVPALSPGALALLALLLAGAALFSMRKASEKV